MDIAPLRGLRFAPERTTAAEVTAPPYDVISPSEHQALLDRSAHNITQLTLGSAPGETSPYEERESLLRSWVADGVLQQDASPRFYTYEICYTAPSSERSCRFLGLIALGRLHAFDERVVLPHEQTFPKVVEDRYQLLSATRTHLESIFLLYSDPDGAIEGRVEAAVRGTPVVEVEAKPGETHALYPIDDPAVISALVSSFESQRPIIADGHHRYTTSLRYRNEAGEDVSGSEWQLMTFANLYSDGLSILATHRLAKLKEGAKVGEVVEALKSRLEPASDSDWELCVETATSRDLLRFPAALRQKASGAGATSYGLLHDVVLDDWLSSSLDGEGSVRYYKEATGESEALASGEGDLLFRLQPVGRQEFQRVVEAGEVFPHKTTYFYPKLWSGLVLWEVESPAVK